MNSHSNLTHIINIALLHPSIAEIISVLQAVAEFVLQLIIRCEQITSGSNSSSFVIAAHAASIDKCVQALLDLVRKLEPHQIDKAISAINKVCCLMLNTLITKLECY